MSQDAKRELEAVKEQLHEKSAEVSVYMQESERLRVDTVCFLFDGYYSMCWHKVSGYARQHYLVPVSQARINWEGCSRKGIRHKNGGMVEVEAPIVRMGWRPDGLSVRLPLLSFPAS